MSKVLNLGIVAHVDAGKTSLTERLLFRAGVIDRIGSVDEGSTQTDSLELERRRGITIKTAVATFTAGDVTVNLIDTPGHPDFIAEVERALRVLDGAVLVVSAVEGVQAQTRVLMRTLRRLRVPTLLFVNKIDRRGARHEDLLAELTGRLGVTVVPVNRPGQLGTPAADVAPLADSTYAEALAEHDDALLTAYVQGATDVPYRRELAVQTAAGLVHPVCFGSAATGAGIDLLLDAVAAYLPAPQADPDAPASGTVFKVERGPAGERIAYVRMFAGTLRVRDRIPDRVTALDLPNGGTATPVPAVGAGRIGRVWGLKTVRVGDTIGTPRPGANHQLFPPPTLETVIVPRFPRDRMALHAALGELAEQDPLINLRHETMSVSLYGEVQKEIIESTLQEVYGIAVAFRQSTVVHVERVTGVGHAAEFLGRGDNPFVATVGLRIEPGPPGSGVVFTVDVPVESIPMYIYKTTDEYHATMTATVRDTLSQGLHGWDTSDCVVTLTASGYIAPRSTAADFRKLTPLVLMSALRRAGTTVCEPVQRFRLDGPADTLSATLGVLSRLTAVPETHTVERSAYTIEGTIPAARVRDLERALPSLSRGEGTLEYAFDHHRPVLGTPPERARWDHNPLDRKEYLLWVQRRVSVG